MKKIILLGLVLFSYSIKAQITINSNDCVVPVSPDTIGVMVNSTNPSYPSPTQGANQSWDYSNMMGGNGIFSLEQPIIFDGYYSNATGMDTYNPSMGSFTLQNSREYYLQDASSFSILGFRTDSNYFDISSMGGNGSYLYFPKSYVVYNNYKTLQFPMTMGSKWIANEVAIIPYRLHVTNFGIFNQDGELKQYIIDSSEVVGYGSLKYPGSSNNYDALLIKRNYSRVDSIFLNGAPANPLLLQQFGVTQGQKTEFYDYLIYIQGLGVPAVAFYYPNLTATSPNAVRYSAVHPQTTSSQNPSNISSFFVFPNPTNQTVRFSQSVNLEIYDLTGKLLMQIHNYEANQALDISQLPQGTLIYKANNHFNEVFTGKIIKQ